jgi:SAM-dependent methyltransferase
VTDRIAAVPEPPDEYRGANYRNWESRVPIHAASQLYDLAAYVDDPTRISHVVAFDVPRLGDLSGLDVVHLQCHIGTDTLSLARLGAKTVTGLDFSPSALAIARKLAADCETQIDFIESEVYDASDALGEKRFDLVYSTVGVLTWLPDIAAWATVAARLLRPGGRLFLRDGHPMMWAVDDARDDGVLEVIYPYFEGEAVRIEDGTTYADKEAKLDEPLTYQWNHGIGEIVNAVLGAGLLLTALTEHEVCSWQGIAALARGPDGRWTLPDRPERLPLMFTLEARKPGGWSRQVWSG